jgi:apolipoprotein D and lipocalin family protein
MPVGRGDYWVVMLDADYRYAVVSEPSREYLWILSRTPQMDGALYDGIVARLRADGYPVNRLVQTPQAAAAPQVARNVPLI